MRKRMAAMWGLVGVVVIVAGGFGLWLATLPSDVAASPPPVPASETAAMLEAPTPPQPRRPLVVVHGLHAATEATPYPVHNGLHRRARPPVVSLPGGRPPRQHRAGTE